MTYKHQNDVIDAVDFMKPSYAEGKHKAIQVEVDEVYRKAEAFDTLLHTYEQYKESHTHDLKSTMGTKAIDLLKERVEE